MAQLERRKKLPESPVSKSQTSPSSEQLLRVEEAYWSTNASPSGRIVCEEHEECPSHCPSQNKKSVLAKVKEGAKKIKYSLSGRRKHIEVHGDVIHDHEHDHDHNHDDHVTPCWTATLEDDYLDEKDYDPEYLGAPMYESEAAPECLKETARQHPRAEPVVSERRRAPTMIKHEAALQQNDGPNTNTITTTTNREGAPQGDDNKPASPNMGMITNVTHTVSEKLGPAYAAVENATHHINTDMITNATHTVSEKLGPACAVVSDATHQIASKLAGMTVTPAESHETSREFVTAPGQHAEVKIINEDAGNLKQCATGSPQTWDKGVSVKEYFLNKLEPGEDERALSQAITEAISPRKSTGDGGVVNKVKGAVTSIFWHDEDSDSTANPQGSTSDIPRTVQLNRVDSIHIEKPASSSPAAAAAAAASPQLNRVASVHVRSSKILNMDDTISSPLMPLSITANEDGVTVYEDENHGKILQTN